MQGTPSRLRRAVGTVAVATGLGIGAAGVAAAVSDNSPATAPARASADASDAAYQSSVRVPEQGERNDGAEAAALQAAAKVTPEQAKQAALAAVPGTAGKVELENENGNVVYGVEVTANGATTDVKVDAGNGSILAKEPDQAEGPNAPESGDGAAPTATGQPAPTATAN